MCWKNDFITNAQSQSEANWFLAVALCLIWGMSNCSFNDVLLTVYTIIVHSAQYVVFVGFKIHIFAIS